MLETRHFECILVAARSRHRCVLSFVVSAQAPNAVISHTKAAAAVLACHRERPCLFSANVEMAASEFSQTVRMHLAKYRDVFKGGKVRAVVKSKARRCLDFVAGRVGEEGRGEEKQTSGHMHFYSFKRSSARNHFHSSCSHLKALILKRSSGSAHLL